MTLPSTRLRVLMCAALLGVLALLGVVAAAVGGTVGVALFAVLAAALVVTAVLRGRAALAPTSLPPGRSCTCCTTTHFDPVTIV
ncbi:MAG: hypothetical protein JWN08_3282 [Frankiales bacterium]|nr:hypothetical protein [Frankiales bacterium]